MAFSEERFQRCKGRLGNLTQTGAEVITAVEGSNDGFHGFMNMLNFPKTKGWNLEYIVYFQDFQNLL